MDSQIGLASFRDPLFNCAKEYRNRSKPRSPKVLPSIYRQPRTGVPPVPIGVMMRSEIR